MINSNLYISKTADELRIERDLAIAYLEKIAQPDPERGFINRQSLAAEVLKRLTDEYGTELDHLIPTS